MRVAVIGAGVVGVTSAYYLAKAGHDVTVIEREDCVANGTSYANGAQLSYSFTDALARPEILRQLPGFVAGRDPAICVRLKPDLDFLRWGMNFIRECTAEKARENTLALLRQSMRSAELFAQLRLLLPGNFSYRAAGKLILLSDETAIRSAEYARDYKADYGCETQVLSLEEAIEVEPAIARMRKGYKGAIYSRGDEVADTLTFTLGLSEFLEDSFATEFLLGTSVDRLVTEKGKLRSVQTSDGLIDVDAAILCTGALGADLLKPLGIKTGVCPVRGYSITVPPGEAAPTVSVTDPKRRIVFSAIDVGMRIAGFADFVGLSSARDEARIKTLLRVAMETAPAAADYDTDSIDGWGGYRAMMINSRPRIGATPVDGLYLNVGHGMLGWTLACSSGEQIADLVSAADSAYSSRAA